MLPDGVSGGRLQQPGRSRGTATQPGGAIFVPPCGALRLAAGIPPRRARPKLGGSCFQMRHGGSQIESARRLRRPAGIRTPKPRTASAAAFRDRRTAPWAICHDPDYRSVPGMAFHRAVFLGCALRCWLGWGPGVPPHPWVPLRIGIAFSGSATATASRREHIELLRVVLCPHRGLWLPRGMPRPLVAGSG